jgi:hypothetical protein
MIRSLVFEVRGRNLSVKLSYVLQLDVLRQNLVLSISEPCVSHRIPLCFGEVRLLLESFLAGLLPYGSII